MAGELQYRAMDVGFAIKYLDGSLQTGGDVCLPQQMAQFWVTLPFFTFGFLL